MQIGVAILVLKESRDMVLLTVDTIMVDSADTIVLMDTMVMTQSTQDMVAAMEAITMGTQVTAVMGLPATAAIREDTAQDMAATVVIPATVD